jgi:glycosyltransferase involved in cell wall biosynthesis
MSVIKRLLEVHRHDLVHCYFFWSINYGRILKKRGVIRFLVENREDEGYSWSRRDYAILRAGRKLPDRVICVSEAVKQVVIEREGLDPRRAVVIHNGVEPRTGNGNRLDARRDLGLGSEDLVVGMVANLNRRVKGVAHFLEAIPLIVESVPSARFVIFGRGREERGLKERARSLEIEPYVIFAGFRPDIDRLYSAMDVSVLTSLSEGLSISLLESMKHGLPVVVTHVGGNPEVVIDEETGYLVPPRDARSFAQKVVTLLRDSDLRRRMGAAGRARAESQFNLQTVAQRYLHVYEELLAPA